MWLKFAATASALAWFGFIAWYSIRAKWWKTPIGRNTFGVSAVLCIVLLRIAVLLWFPDLKQSKTIGAIIYTGAAILGAQRIVFVEKAQREVARLKALGYTRRKTDGV